MSGSVRVERESQHASEFFSCRVGDQWLGFPVDQVLEVIVQQQLTPMPLAPPVVLGLINLRGRIITEVDVRKLVDMDAEATEKSGHVVIVQSDQGEDVGLLVDEVGEVAAMDVQHYENMPDTLDPVWLQIGEGVLKAEDKVTVIANVDRLLALSLPEESTGGGLCEATAEQSLRH
ncbi:MAG: chemotaxis protein CheW [Mariprofundaceae bacterium]|nr:chemotaxis protein CheW [Mariprofundaceae bacterium]